MEERNDKLMNPTPYYCNICKIYCASPINLQSHFLGIKHKAVEDALKAHGIVKPLNPSGEAIRLPESLPDFVHTEPEKCLGNTLEEQLNSCKDSEPAIGLQYIIEYRSKDSLVYECNLCISQAGLTNMFMHVLGVKHRMAYLKKHRPDLADVKGRGSKLNLRLKELAAQVEEEEGRQPIKSTMDLPIPKEDIYSVQLSDSFVTWFTEDDDGKGKKKEDPKSTAKETDKDASKAEGDGGNKSEDKKKLEQSTSQQQSALFVDSDSDSDEFTSNEGLLKYLKSFEIVDEDDAAFILKVTQKFTDALILYREKASGRQSSQEQNQKQNQSGNSGAHSVQKTSVGASKPRAEVDFSEWELPDDQSFENVGTNSGVKIPAKRKASELHADPSKDPVKTRKRGDFAPAFKAAPNAPDAKGPGELQGPRPAPHDARRLNAGRGPDAAARDLRRQQAAQKRERQHVPPVRRNQPSVPPSVPSQSERNVTGKRKMEEALDTMKFSLPFSAYVGPRKTVWIVGHNIVYFAEAYAASSGWGTGLGLEDRLQITWMGKRGMQWDDLLPAVSLQVVRLGSPDALIIQLGENDLPGKKGIDLHITMSADLHALMSRLPNTRIFWSDLLERREWPGASTPEKVDQVRREVSSSAGRLIEATGGFIIQHPDITFKHTALFKADGIHLSEWGQDIWLHSIRHALLCWAQS